MKMRFALASALAFLVTPLMHQAYGEPEDLDDDMIAIDPDVDEGFVEDVRIDDRDIPVTGQEGVDLAGSYDDSIGASLDPVTDREDPELPLEQERETPAPIIDPMVEELDPNDPATNDPSRVAYSHNRVRSRTMSLAIPGPRGAIIDREGEMLATSEVAYQPAILFGQLDAEQETDEHIIALATQVCAAFEALGLKIIPKTDEQIIAHYRNRRWLPLPICPVVRTKEMNKVRKKLEAIEHAEIMPVYIRRYPAGQSACHILGYPSTESKLSTGPINHNDPIFQRQEGRSGLEKTYDKHLRPRDGERRLLFDEQGTKVLDEIQVVPRPGNTVVTTLNLNWQRQAEKALREHTRGRAGAFVLVDCHTGEILVMASYPNFDPNTFVPAISQEDYDKLRNDDTNPLVSRAFAGAYPPASTFKTVTVAAALRHRIITEKSYIYCPQSITIGRHTFRNHSAYSGSLNCVGAITLSNNPFMYQIAATMSPSLGAARLCDYARRFGFGSAPDIGLPTKGGLVPNSESMVRRSGRDFMQGDAANLSIGQGMLLATPLQVAHSMAAFANGEYLMKLQLIRQILDQDGNVIWQMEPQIQTDLRDSREAMSVVRKGMRAVVDNGTGRRAALSYASNAGKTGTAQWGPRNENRRLAWFAGYMPADNPRYAYVALYEGRKNEKISGGRMAAGIVKSFFEGVKPSMKLALEEEEAAISIKNKPYDPLEEEEEAEEILINDSAREAEAREAREREARARRRGWDDGRSRN